MELSFSLDSNFALNEGLEGLVHGNGNSNMALCLWQRVLIGVEMVCSTAFLKWKWCVEWWWPKGPQLKYGKPANHVFQIFVGPISVCIR